MTTKPTKFLIGFAIVSLSVSIGTVILLFYVSSTSVSSLMMKLTLMQSRHTLEMAELQEQLNNDLQQQLHETRLEILETRKESQAELRLRLQSLRKEIDHMTAERQAARIEKEIEDE